MSWQKCPNCGGSGAQPKLRYSFRQDAETSARPAGWETCGVCKGKQIISSETGLPPGATPEATYSGVDSSRLLCPSTLKGLRFEGKLK